MKSLYLSKCHSREGGNPAFLQEVSWAPRLRGGDGVEGCCLKLYDRPVL